MTLFDQIFRLIEKNSLDEIKQTVDGLHPEQCVRVLNASTDFFTLLFSAILRDKVEISRYLLEISLRQGRDEMCENWKKTFHPLNAALEVGNIELIELISRNLCDINDYVHCPFTPLILAIFTCKIEYVRLMLHLGADINATSFNGVSPLMASIYSSDICQFLIGEKANLDHQDEEGSTALHGAVIGTSLQTLKILVDAGADVKIRNKQGFTPLMLAAAKTNTELLVYLIKHSDYSELDRIEALEIMNACFVCDEHPIISGWIQALEMRGNKYIKSCTFPAEEHLDFSQEFTTGAELEKLQCNTLSLSFQAVLVIERTLGRNNCMYIKLLLKSALIAKHENNMDKFRQLIDYCCDTCQTKPAAVIAAYSPLFKSLFTQIAENGDHEIFLGNGIFALFKMIAQKTEEMWLFIKEDLPNSPHYENRDYSELVDTFLYMTYMIKKSNLPQQYENEFYQVIKHLVKSDPRTVNKQSLLHRVIKLSDKETWCSLELIRVLVESGADINSKDYFRRTPVMYNLEYTPDAAVDEILEYLKEHGAHVDCRNSEGYSALDVTPWVNRVIIPKNTRSLVCLATEVILDNQIPYEEDLSNVHKAIINLHK